MPRAAARSRTPARSAGTATEAESSTSTGSATTRPAQGRGRFRCPSERASGSRPWSSTRDPPRDDAQPHRHPPAACGAPGAARHPRPPGRVRRAPRQAALRLHAWRAAQRGGAARDRGRGSTTGSRRASRPGAARWTERRPRRSGRWRSFGEKYGEWVRVVEVEDVSRELLRWYARRQHRGGRDLRDRLRGLERVERAAGRGADRARGDRLVPRPQRAVRGDRRAARFAAGPGRGRRGGRRSGSRSWRPPRRGPPAARPASWRASSRSGRAPRSTGSASWSPAPRSAPTRRPCSRSRTASARCRRLRGRRSAEPTEAGSGSSPRSPRLR